MSVSMEALLVVFMVGLLIVAGVVIVGMGIQSRRHIREMEHRERLAMIERGLSPPPDFESAAAGRTLSNEDANRYARILRWRTAGIVMIGLGFAYFFLVAFAVRSPEIGVGVGGAFVTIGAAFFLNAMMLQRSFNPHGVRRPEPRVPPSSGPRVD
jgi:hypothetical protein